MTVRYPDRVDVLEAIEVVQAGYLRIVRADPLAQQSMAADEWGDILEVVLRLTDSSFGFVGALVDDPETGQPYLQTYAVSNIAWDEETRRFYEEARRKYGMQFRNLDSLFGKVITTESVVISNDPETDDRSGGTPHGHPKLESFLGVPLSDREGMFGMFGIANRPGGYDDQLVEVISPFTRALGNLVSTRSATSQRIEAEQKQRLESLLIRTIVENAGQGIIAFDGDGVVQIANGAAEQILDRSSENLVGEHIQECIGVADHHWATGGGWMKSALPHLEAGELSVTREVYALRKGGARVPIHVSFNRIEDGDKTLFVAVFGDLSDMALELARVRHDVERLIETANAPIFAVDETGRISEWNARVSQLTGYPKEEALGRTFVETMIDELHRDRLDGIFSAALSGDDISDYVASIRTKDGRPVRLLLNATGRRDDDKQVIGVICVGQDITERIRAEEERNTLLQERASLIRRLYRVHEDQQKSIVYDLHDGPAQLLAGADMMLQNLIAKQAGVEASDSRELSDAQKHVQTALLEVQRIMAVLRPSVLDDLGLVMALHELCDVSSRRTNMHVRFRNDLSTDHPLDQSWEIVLYRIAQEAINNALKHSRSSATDVWLHHADHGLVLQISDTGKGFQLSPTQSGRRGTGMGLAGMRERAELIGATVTVQSETGAGTVVTVTLPLGDTTSPVETEQTHFDD